MCAIVVNVFSIPSLRNTIRSSEELLLGLVVLIGIVYSSFHCLYYGVLYAPLFAELDYSVVDIVRGVLASPYSPPSTREAYEEALKYMTHFGLNKR